MVSLLQDSVRKSFLFFFCKKCVISIHNVKLIVLPLYCLGVIVLIGYAV